MTGMRMTIPIPLDSDEELSKCLKPCPFCKAKGYMLSIWDDNDYIKEKRKYVYCHKCGAQGSRAGTDGEAIELWNRRVSE